MVTGKERGMGKEAVGVWPVGATPLLSDQPNYFPASALPAAETLSLPAPHGERHGSSCGGGVQGNSQRPPGLWGTTQPLFPPTPPKGLLFGSSHVS